MRWIDIILPEPGIHQEVDALLSDAVAKMARIPEIQARDGLDASGKGGVLFDAGVAKVAGDDGRDAGDGAGEDGEEAEDKAGAGEAGGLWWGGIGHLGAIGIL
jgi:hypothetical protein